MSAKHFKKGMCEKRNVWTLAANFWGSACWSDYGQVVGATSRNFVRHTAHEALFKGVSTRFGLRFASFGRFASAPKRYSKMLVRHARMHQRVVASRSDENG